MSIVSRLIAAFRAGYLAAARAWVSAQPLTEEQIVQLEAEMEAAGRAQFEADRAASTPQP